MNQPAFNTLAAVQGLVFDMLRHEYGDAALVVTGSGVSMIPIRVPADPLAAAKVAKDLTIPLRHLVAEYVRASRGQGHSWLGIAQALQFDDEEWSPEHAAFSYVAGELKLSHGRPFFWWRCRSCGGQIRDWGPELGPHPSHSEEGHARACCRHSADVRAYLRQLADE